jgi:hypothetical protein
MIFQHHMARITQSATFYGGAGVSLSTANSMDVQGVSFFRQQSGTGTGINKKCRCRYRNKGSSPVSECSGTGLRYRMSEYRCRRHRGLMRIPSYAYGTAFARYVSVKFYILYTRYWYHVYCTRFNRDTLRGPRGQWK